MGNKEQVLTIRIGAQISEALSGVNKIGDRVEKFGKDVQRTGKLLSRNLTAPIAAMGAAAAAAVVRVGNVADKLLDLEQQTGLTTDQLQEFRRVATVAGVDQDTVAIAAQNLTRRLKAAGEETLDTRRALEQLGVSTRDSSGQVREMDQMLPELITKLQGVESITERNSLATEIFGRGAQELAPILGMSAERFAEVTQEARDMGLVLNRDALEGANESRIAIDTLKESVGTIANELGIALIPVINTFVDILQDHVIPVVRKAVEWVSNIDAGFLTMIATIAGIVAAVGPMLLVFGKVIAVLGLVMNPVGLVIAAIGALSVIVITLVRNWERFLGFWIGLWKRMAEMVFDGVDGILAGLERLTSAIPGLARVVSKARDGLQALADQSLAGASKAMEWLQERSAATAEEMDETAVSVDGLAGSMDDLEETAIDTGGAFGGLALSGEELTARLGEVELGIVGVDTAFRRVPDALNEMETGSRVALSKVAQNVQDTRDSGLAAFGGLREGGERDLSGLSRRMGDVASQGNRAFVDFAFGARGAIKGFVSDALRQLARLVSSRLFSLAFSALGGPLGGALGGKLGSAFGGFFADGGVLRPGQSGFVGEAGMEMVTAGSTPLRITPFSDMGGGGGGDMGGLAAAILGRLGPEPQPADPSGVAVSSWYRRLFGEMAADAKRRGVL